LVSGGQTIMAMTYTEPYTPYAGLIYNKANQPVKAPSGPHVLLSAPTRTGKTRRILAPAAVTHPGPAVLCSSSPDLAKLVLQRRFSGVTGVIDLRPEQTRVWPSDVRRWVTDPTKSITDAHEALTVAETMLATSGVGFGGASSGGTVAAGGLWETSAARPLACLLYAASPLGNGQGMPWVLQAVEDFGTEDPSEEDGGGRAGEIGRPSWLTAYALCPVPDLAQPLYGVLAMDGRLRDSVKITVTKAVTPWVRLSLSARENAARLDALERLSVDSFDVRFLDEPDATLFVIAPNAGTVAGVAVALIDSIIRHFRRKEANDELQHRLLLELDEVCNSCPLPDLLTYIGESAKLGVNIMATVQSSEQFKVVFGTNYADALRDLFPATLIMYGSYERHLLEQASHWLGETTRRTESYGPQTGHRNLSSNFGQMIGWQELLPQSREEAQLLQRGTAGTRVLIPEWTEWLQIYDQALQRRLERRQAGLWA
jgi:type IV secretion system protein VirD4